jgi:outer membrane receptor protein involved in Fe transport
MNRKSFTAFVLCTSAVLALAVTPRSFGQAAAAQTTTTTTTSTEVTREEDVVKLSPFVVNAEEDKGSYQASSTLAGTRVRTDLKDVASAISVVTGKFLQDTGAKNSADLLVYTPSTEVAGIRGNFSGVAGTGIYQENTVSSTTRVRGLDSADNTRDYFLTDIPWDGFNVGRVDLQRGPNSILFGIGSPAGIINTSLNDANFKTAYHVENRLDRYGSMRNEIDLNQTLVPGVLAIRVAAVKDNELYEQKPAFNNSSRYYGALRFDPKIFSEENHTSIRAKFEQGDISSNNPRSVPPNDDYTMWFRTTADAYGNPGYNKIILNGFSPSQVFNGVAYPAGIGGSTSLGNGLALTNQTRSFWPDVINYYEGTPRALNQAAGQTNAFFPSGTPMKTIVAQPQDDLGVRVNATTGLLDPAGNTLGAVFKGFLPRMVPMMSGYAKSVGETTGFPGFSGNNNLASIPGGVYYSNIVIQDPSIFDFYKKLLDGPNKHEWSNWKAYNLTVDQSFFNDRLAFQFAMDHQAYTEGALRWMTGENYAISIDVNATFADQTANPNAGRPYAGNAASAPSLNYQETRIRDVGRGTVALELRASDLLGDTSLAKILGKHNFTGLYEQDKLVKNHEEFAEYATTAQYMLDNRRNDAAHQTTTGQLSQDRSFEWIVYLGPTQINNSSKTGAGANLQKIDYVVAPPRNQTALNFNARWNKPLVPGSPGYVDPTAPFTYINPSNPFSSQVVNGFQADNPANYVGWSQQPVTWMSSSDPVDFPSLVQAANRTRFKDTSQGFTWQGYLFGGDFVPTFGWRKDVITNYQTNAQTDPLSGFTSTNFADDLGSRTDVRGESKTWGGVYHLPKSLTSKLPWDSTISLFYDRGRNFKADASRLSMAGLPIPNATGQTKEYGITITTLQDKLSLKVAKFKTKVSNATLADTQGNSIGGLGNNAYFIADGSIWGYGWATYLQDALLGINGAVLSTYGDYAGSSGFTRNTPAEIAAADAYNRTGGTSPTGDVYAGGNAVVNAWLHGPFPASFFSSYNLSPNVIPTLGTASGHLRDSYPAGYNDAGGPQLGGGSNFGNHQTTVDNLSEGYEAELTYQPIKNWNITVNYSKAKATHENIDPVSVQFLGALTAFMNGPGGQIREWGNGAGNPLRNQWNSSIVAPYAVFSNALGHEAPEVSPWRVNLVTTYTFDHGAAKGVFVGGAFRQEAGRILGYHYSSTIQNSISTDPNFAAVTFLTLGGLDVNQPFRGKTESFFDGWVGYTRKITHNIDWRIQLNMRSIGQKDHLVTGGVNPDGSIALARIVQGMGWQLTNSFEF